MGIKPGIRQKTKPRAAIASGQRGPFLQAADRAYARIVALGAMRYYAAVRRGRAETAPATGRGAAIGQHSGATAL